MKELTTAIISLLLFTSAFSQSGTLQLHPGNPHYFLYQNKATLLIGSGEHYGSVVNTDFDYQKYLQTLAKDGLNLTRLFTGAYVEKLGDFGIQKNTLAPSAGKLLLPWKRSNAEGYVLGGNKFDLNHWDEAYFTRLKDFISAAKQNKVIVEVNLFSSYYGGGWNYSAFNPKNNMNGTNDLPSNQVNTLKNGNILKYQEQYVRKIVRELNNFENVYFEIQNEPWADQTDTVLIRDDYGAENDWRATIQVVSQRSNDWQREVARWIKDEERSLPNKHLISKNIGNFYYPVTHPDPNVSIFNFHYALPQAVWENDHLNKVIGFNETGFAGSSDATYRRQAWRFMMAGGGLFNQLDYSFSVGAENGQDTSYKAPGGGSAALRNQFSVLKHFFEGLNFVTLRPDLRVVEAAPGAMVEALSNGKNQWVLYYEPMALKSNSILLRLPAGKYNAAWKDAVTGHLLKNETVINGKLVVPEGSTEMVVVIKKISK